MTLRKLSLAAVASVAIVSSSFAANKWAVGVANMFGSFEGGTPALQATFMSDQFIATAGLGYTSLSNDAHAAHEAVTNLSVGLRNMTSNQVSVDYGLNVNYAFMSWNDGHKHSNPYNLGAFVGLDYSPVDNVLMSARIQPYTYARNSNKVKLNNFFNMGSLSVSYVF